MNDDRKTCQICGRSILAKNGLIAHHGYQRPGEGYQTGSCAGARRNPFEVSRDYLGKFIATITDLRERQIAHREAVLAGTIPTIITVTAGIYQRDGTRRFPMTAETAEEVFLEIEKLPRHKGWRQMHGVKTFEQARDRYAKSLQSQIDSDQTYIAQQQSRFDGWSAKE